MQIDYSQKKHIPVLDGIRGLAILLVLIFHLFDYIPITKIGWIGVDLFFVLSGFLITGILLNTKDSPNYYQSFIIRRALRIFPLYYGFLVFFMIIVPFTSLSQSITDYDYLTEHQVYYWFYLQNWLASFDQNWPTGNAISHLWSLAVEEQFYLLWPFVVYFLSHKQIKTCCIAIVILAILIRNLLIFNQLSWVAPYINTLARFDSLAIGALLVIYIRYNKEFIEKYISKFLLVTGVLFISILIIIKANGGHNPLLLTNPIMQSIGFTVIGFFFAALIAISLQKNGKAPAFFSNPPLLFLGKYSYGLYVYHSVLDKLFFNEIYTALGANGITSNILTSLSILASSVILSYISFHYYEKHFLKFKKLVVVKLI
ncbi:acyltransferase (plasmid) [Flammeovirgaceae bacterium SG7u.111]|nr:acyltransferase [Flammeovirgaceae bacterium SG7u.132]WPO38832.1 acyltransferase [Flammeovirgaceae bacterium SG7u.111]